MKEGRKKHLIVTDQSDPLERGRDGERGEGRRGRVILGGQRGPDTPWVRAVCLGTWNRSGAKGIQFTVPDAGARNP